MVRKWEAMYYLRKLRGFSLVALLAVVPSLAFADTIVTSQAYVDMQDATKVSIGQGTGTNNENVGKGLVVNASGNLALANILQAIGTPTNSITANDGYVVKSVAVNTDGKTIDVVRDTVKVPVASGAPSSNTPTSFAEVWIQ